MVVSRCSSTASYKAWSAALSCALWLACSAQLGACGSDATPAPPGQHDPVLSEPSPRATQAQSAPDADPQNTAAKSQTQPPAADGGRADPPSPDAAADAGTTHAPADAGPSPVRSEPSQADPPNNQPNPAPASLTEIAAGLSTALCGALEDCLGAQKLSTLFGHEPCIEHVRASLVQADLAGLEASISAQRVRVNTERLEVCYRDLRAQGCGVHTQRLPQTCQEAIAGQVASGAVCSMSSDCAGDAFCSRQCPRTCTARAAEAASCERDEECRSGLACSSGICSTPAASGAACAGNSNAVCALGSSCVGNTDLQPGTCKPNGAVQVGQLGAACMPGGSLCREGLSCAWDGASAFSCQNGVGDGAACRLALPSQCSATQYCNAVDIMTQGRCTALPSDGAACVLGDQCAAQHVCFQEAAQRTCRKLSNLGETCASDALCRSGHCTAGRCATSAVCP